MYLAVVASFSRESQNLMASRSKRHDRRKQGGARFKGLCKYFAKGSCLKGSDCDFAHDFSQKESVKYENPNEAMEGEEELFMSRSDMLFVVGHSERCLAQLKDGYAVSTRLCWSKGKMFMRGSDEEKQKFVKDVKQHLESKEVGYLPIPADISVHYVVGRQGKTLSQLGKTTNTFCKVQPRQLQDTEWKIEIMAYSSSELEDAKKTLAAKLFTQAPMVKSILCINTASNCENLRIIFKSYTRYKPVNLRKRCGRVLEMGLQENPNKQAPATFDEVIFARGLDRLQIEEGESRGGNCHSPNDLSRPRMSPHGYIHEDNVLYVYQWTKDKLRMLEDKGLVPKLEARFGKVLWTDMPPDIAASAYSILEFEQEEALNLKTTFATFTDSDLTCLTEGLGNPFVLESYDLKVVPGAELKAAGVAQRIIDLRVTVSEGHFNLASAFGDESQKYCADWICLDGKYDFRISVSSREILKLRDEFHHLVATLHKEDENFLSYENVPELTVNYIRHKKKCCYLFGDSPYCIAIYKIQEYSIDRCCENTIGKRLTADFQTVESHDEIELQNQKWMARFYTAAGHSIETAFAAEQSCPPKDVLGYDEPWTTESISSELREFLKQIHNVCEILKDTS